MPGRRRPDDFSLFRKSQAPRFTGPGAEAKTGSGSAETENGRGGLAVSAAPCAMQVRLRRSDAEYILERRSCFFAGPGAEAKTGSGSAETENGRGGLAVSAAPCAMQVRLRRSDAEYILERRSCFSPGRVQSRRPVRVLPRRRTAEGACRYRRPVCSAGLPSGRADADISSEEEAVFRRAGRRAEVCPIVSKKERRRPVRAVFSCRFLLRTQPAEHGPGGWLPPPEAAAARPEERRSENRRMLEECRFWRLRVLAGRAVQRSAIRKTSDVRRGVGCGGEGSIAGRTARKRRNSLYRPVGTDGRASQLENRRPPILLRESAGEAPVRWW